MNVNIDFSLATENLQLTTEGPFIQQKKEKSETNLFSEPPALQSPLHNLKNYCFTTKSTEKKNETSSHATTIFQRSSLQEDTFLNSAQEEQLNAFEHQLYNPGNEFMLTEFKDVQNKQTNNPLSKQILQIRINHTSDIFEFFEKEQQYHAIEIIDYERFLSVGEFAIIDKKLRGLSKKFKALRFTNTELTSAHLKILQHGLLSKRTDLEIQLNNNNIDDKSFFDFLIESRCYKLIAFINNIGILKFIEQIYGKYQTQQGRPKNMVRINQYNMVLERTDDDLLFLLHTGSNQFRYLNDVEDEKQRYTVVNYDIKMCSKSVIESVLSCQFTHVYLPQILFLAIKIEEWNVLLAGEAISKIKTINTLDLGGSKDLAFQHVAKVFLKDRQFKIKHLIIRNIPFSNPSFKLFVQHFLYSEFTVLKGLDVSDCEINDDKIFLLCENIRLSTQKITVQQLYLQKNPLIGEEGWFRLFSLMIFGKCTNITDLDIRGCLITQKLLQDGIIAGMRASHRFIRKFCLRFPLRRFFVSSSEMSVETWRLFLNSFLFYAKVGLTHYNFYFTGFFMQNNILNNDSHFLQKNISESKNENILVPSLYSTHMMSDKVQGNKPGTLQTMQQAITVSNHSSPKSQTIQPPNSAKDATSLNVFQNSSRVMGSSSRQERQQSQSQTSSDTNSLNIKSSEGKLPEQQLHQIYDSEIFNNIMKNPIDDSVIQNEIKNSDLNMSGVSSITQQGTNSSNNKTYSINSPTLVQKPSSQTQLNNPKSIFSKEGILKHHHPRKGSNGSNSKVQFLQQEGISIPSSNNPKISKESLSPVSYKNTSNPGPVSFQKSTIQIPQSPCGAKSLDQFHSPKSTSKERDVRFTLDNEKSNEQDSSKDKCEITFENKIDLSELCYANHPLIKRSLQQLDGKNSVEQTFDYEQSILQARDSNILKNDCNLSVNLQSLDLSKVELVPPSNLYLSGNQYDQNRHQKKSSISKSAQNSYPSSPNIQAAGQKSLNLSMNTESKGAHLKRNQWLKLNSYSHQKRNNKFGSNKKMMRSITHTSGSSLYKNFDENMKNKGMSSNTNAGMDKNRQSYSKSSFGYKHMKSTQEIMENINQVVFNETLNSLSQINGTFNHLFQSKTSQEHLASPLQLNPQFPNKEGFISQSIKNILFNKDYPSQESGKISTEGEVTTQELGSEVNKKKSGQFVSFNLNDELRESSEKGYSVSSFKRRLHSSQDKGYKVMEPSLQNSPLPKTSQSISEKTILEPIKFVQATSIHYPNQSIYQESNGSKNQTSQKDLKGDPEGILKQQATQQVPPIQFPPSFSDVDETKQSEQKSQKKMTSSKNFAGSSKDIPESSRDIAAGSSTPTQRRIGNTVLSVKQTRAVEKVKKSHQFGRRYRKTNCAGVITKQEVAGSEETAIYHLFNGFLKQKRCILQQLIFHTTESFPYLSSVRELSSSAPQFRGNLSPAGWQRLFFILSKCSIFIAPIQKQSTIIPILPLFNENFEHRQPMPEDVIKAAPTETYKKLKFFYINAESQLHRIYRGNLSPLQWLYFNPKSNIEIIKTNCYSTFINLEKNIKLKEEKENDYKFKVQILDFNWEGQEKGWRIFAQNVMLNRRFQLKQLYLKNVQIDSILSLIDEFKSRYDRKEIASETWNLDVLCFSYSSCSTTLSFIKFLFLFYSSNILKIVYNAIEDQFYVFGPNYKDEMLDYNISLVDFKNFEEPYSLRQSCQLPYKLFAPYIAHFFVSRQGNFFPHFFTKSISIQFSEQFTFNSIIQVLNHHKRLFQTNINSKIKGHFQSRFPTPPALKLKQFICDQQNQSSRMLYSKLMEPCFMLSYSRDDFTDQIIQFNCSLFEGGSLVIDPPKLKEIIVAINIINFYSIDTKGSTETKNQFQQQNYSLRDKFHEEIRVYLPLSDKMQRYRDVVGFTHQKQEIQLYQNYQQYLEYKEYMQRVAVIGFLPEYHHPYNYYNCLDVHTKSVVLIFETTCSNSCGQRCGRTADILFYYNELFNLSKKCNDYVSFIKLNKRISPYFFSPFIQQRIIEKYNEEHLLNFLFATTYIEGYNYNQFDEINTHHCYLLLIIQYSLSLVIMLSTEYIRSAKQKLELSFAFLSFIFTFFLFFYELYLVYLIFKKSKPLISLNKLEKISSLKHLSKQNTLKQHFIESRTIRHSNASHAQSSHYIGSASAQALQSQNTILQSLKSYHSHHWLLYKSPKEIVQANTFTIVFASFKSLLSTMTFFTQILIEGLSEYVVFSTSIIYVISFILMKYKTLNKLYRDNVWFKGFLMNIVEFDILDAFAQEISLSYAFCLPNIRTLFGNYAGRNISVSTVLQILKLLIRDIPIYLLWLIQENSNEIEDFFLNLLFCINLFLSLVSILRGKVQHLTPERGQEIVTHSRMLLKNVKYKFLAEYDKQLEAFLSIFR